MSNEKQEAPFYIRAIAWFIIHAPYYAAFYALIESIKWYTSTK